MNEKEFGKLLREIGACGEAVRWAKGKSLAEVWEQCERGDWLLWLCGRMADKQDWPSRMDVVLAACACAETALKYVKAGEDRPRIAIETARKWARGEATIQEVRTDAYAAYAAAAAAYAAAAAAYAASDADAAADAAAAADAYAAYAAAAAAYAAYAAAYAAYAAADAAAAARREESRLAVLKQCADIVRTTITLPLLKGVAA